MYQLYRCISMCVYMHIYIYIYRPMRPTFDNLFPKALEVSGSLLLRLRSGCKARALCELFKTCGQASFKRLLLKSRMSLEEPGHWTLIRRPSRP